MKKLFFTVFATCLLTLAAYLLRDGVDHAGERFEEFVALLSGNGSSKNRKLLTDASTPAPAPPPELPASTHAPAATDIVATATPIPTPVPAATPDPNEPRLVLQSLEASREEWPHQVLLKKPVTFPVIVNGAVAGRVEVPRNTPVQLVSLKATAVGLSFQGATQTVNANDTDLIERVRENRRQGIIPNPPKIALAPNPAPATPEPRRSTFFEDLNKAAKIPAKVNLPADVAVLVKEAEELAPNPKSKFIVDETIRRDWKEKAKRYMDLPVDQVTAHPAAAAFPGSVPPDAPRIKREFNFPLNLPRWQSTGLYAAPGEKVTVHVTSQDANRGLSIVIGAQHDEIFAREKWPRFPVISRTFKITETRTVVANAFGGLIYVNIPRDKEMGGYNVPTYGGYGWLDENPKDVRGSIRVTIEGGVEAALYQAGQTTTEQWQKMKQSPAPWGEIASQRIILTLPAEVLKGMENPAPLLAFWDQVVEAEDALAGWPVRFVPPERIVPDQEISAGFMHSGYPIMCQMVSIADLVDLRKLKERGGWGFFHELGHNHEPQACTFGGDYVEVVVNFFSLYVMEMVVKKEMTSGHPALDDLEKLLQARLGPEKNKGAFENLAMYIPPIKALGVEAFQKTVSSYSTPDGARGIKSREDKMDQWVLRYSQATGKNLAPYFEAFEVTCSTQTKETLKKLPVWLPKANFPRSYEN